MAYPPYDSIEYNKKLHAQKVDHYMREEKRRAEGRALKELIDNYTESRALKEPIVKVAPEEVAGSLYPELKPPANTLLLLLEKR